MNQVKTISDKAYETLRAEHWTVTDGAGEYAHFVCLHNGVKLDLKFDTPEEAWVYIDNNYTKPAQENNFPTFQKYACVGDKIQWVNGEFLLTATIHEDCDTKPEDSYCYREDDILLFNLDQWFYCGIVISVEKQGIMIEDHAASLWGIECNFPGSDNSYLSEVAQELENEAIETGKAKMQRMIAVLQS